MQSVHQAGPAPSPTSSIQPYRVIKPGRSGSLINFHEIWLYRDLIMALAVRDIKLRYKQTLLGAIWVVFQPLMSAGIFSFIFNGIANLPTDGVPPYVYTFTGMLIWTVFSSIVTKTSNIMVSNSNLVSKVYFPRICLPLSVIPSTIIDLLISMCVLVVLMISYKIMPGIGLIFWPLIMGLTMILALGFGLISAALGVNYRDIQYIVPVVMSLLMYASPLAYSASVVTNSAKISPIAKFVYSVNPLVEILSTSRYLLIGQGHINPISLGISVLMTIVVAIAGLSCFRALERKFADVI